MPKQTKRIAGIGFIGVTALLYLCGCNNADAVNPPPAMPAKNAATVPQNIPADQKASVEASIKYGAAKQAEANAQGNVMMAGQQKAAQARAGK